MARFNMTYHFGMSPVERECLKITVAWLRKQEEMKETYQEKLQEARHNYALQLEEHIKFKKLCATKYLSEEKELHHILDWFVDQQLAEAEREVKKWINLLAIPKEDGTLEKAKRVPIEELYQFEKIQCSTGRIKALCPFHEEKSPSFVIYEDNHFHCFGCGQRGDSIDFVKLRDNCSTREAINLLNGV